MQALLFCDAVLSGFEGNSWLLLLVLNEGCYQKLYTSAVLVLVDGASSVLRGMVATKFQFIPALCCTLKFREEKVLD